MIVARIKRHNIVNGFVFSLVEFALVAAIVGGFSVYALIQEKTVVGLVGLAIAVNCLPVMLYSVQSLRANEKQIGFRAWLTRTNRALIAQRYPETGVDTVVIVIATIVPLLAVLLTTIDVVKGRSV
jgi:hypothetical protein